MRLTLAGPSVADGSGQVSVEALLAIVAVAAGGVVAAVHADASALPPRQFIQLHVEAAAAGVEVAVARCGGRRGEREREGGGESGQRRDHIRECE